MSLNCTHDCSSCGSECKERTAPQSMLEKPNDQAKIKKVIGVVSGKGGVGKSLVTGLLAARLQKCGLRTAVLDADITGPSIPRMFGVEKKATAIPAGILPAVTAGGTQVMSVNLLLPHDTDPVIWRGPIIAGVVKQFWTDVIWQDVDYLFVDMPPGTGDVPLTVFQSIPVDGIVVVTSPQELVGMIVGKAVKMAEEMHIPVLGLVENMSYYECPDCHSRHAIFGESHAEELARRYQIPAVARLPIDPSFAKLCDEGRVEEIGGNYLDRLIGSFAPELA
ncbi:MAG: Mrp/NBP35 family ATP-binding protein [Eubacteriales bacterium]|nr:Mrp/NBP35 family ATP-binding protein [Eubacteriales bacterium]